MSKNDFSATCTRREALSILGLGAAAATLPAATAGPEFAKKAIVRTILKDMPPEALAGGPTLFHEHMSLAQDFKPRWMAYARASNPNGGRGRANAAPPAAPQSNLATRYVWTFSVGHRSGLCIQNFFDECRVKRLVQIGHTSPTSSSKRPTVSNFERA